jgi:integrase
MSVYRPKASPFFHYDFQRQNHRFCGSTERTSKLEALKVEDEKKREADRLLRESDAFAAAPMSIDTACGRYWDEVGQHHKRPDQTDWSLDWIVTAFGPERLIRDIGDGEIAMLVAKRRGERAINVAAERGSRRKARAGAPPRKCAKLVSPARVNRSVTEPLRKVLRRAEAIWKEKVQKIDWKTHLLKEPEERIRVMRAGEEETAVFAAMPEKYRAVIAIKRRLGFRIGELVAMEWPDLDWGGRRILVEGKGGSRASVPMPSDVRDILWGLPRRHPRRVFTHEDGSPMTYSAIASAWRRAMPAAATEDLRLHDLRHTAATDLLSESGNLRLVQKLLRHKDLRSTLRYAHALDSDLRDALEAIKSPVESPEEPAKPLKDQA